MKKQIRFNIYETASSSVHALVVSTKHMHKSKLKIADDGYVHVSLTEYYGKDEKDYKGQREKLTYVVTWMYIYYGCNIEELYNGYMWKDFNKSFTDYVGNSCKGILIDKTMFDGDEISHLAGLIEEGHRSEELTFSHEYLLLLLAHYLGSCCLFDNDIAHAEAGGMVHAIITVGVDGCFQGKAVGAFSHQGAPYGVGGAALPEYGGAIARPHSCTFAVTGIRQHGTVNSVHEGVGRREGTPNGRFVEEVGRMGVERIVAG